MKVKDIMTTKVISVEPGTKIAEIARSLFKNRIHAVPVVEDKKVVGIITEVDFFTRDVKNIFLPSYIDFIRDTEINQELDKEKKEKIDKLLNLEAKDIMTKNCVCILDEMDVKDLLKFFQETRFTTIPVVNNGNDLVGIVAVADVISLIKA